MLILCENDIFGVCIRSIKVAPLTDSIVITALMSHGALNIQLLARLICKDSEIGIHGIADYEFDIMPCTGQSDMVLRNTFARRVRSHLVLMAMQILPKLKCLRK